MSRIRACATVSMVAFLVVVGGLSCGTRKDGSEGTATVARVFVIEGMSCQGCADTITLALIRIPGVQSAEVSLKDKRAVVVAKESEVPTERIVAAISDAGYQGRLAQSK